MPEKYSLVTCFETLEHVGNLETALHTIRHCIADNGLALLSVPIETGIIGIIKYLLKVKIYGDKLKEIGAENQKSYFKSLIKGEDISRYRKKGKDLWWDHFGFNYKVIETYFREKGIKYRGFTFFTTRFVLVYSK